MNEADGVILVYNPDSPGQDQQIGDWFEFFVRKNGLKEEQCLVLAHKLSSGGEKFRPRKYSSICFCLLFYALFLSAIVFACDGIDDDESKWK